MKEGLCHVCEELLVIITTFCFRLLFVVISANVAVSGAQPPRNHLPVGKWPVSTALSNHGIHSESSLQGHCTISEV